MGSLIASMCTISLHLTQPQKIFKNEVMMDSHKEMPPIFYLLTHQPD